MKHHAVPQYVSPPFTCFIPQKRSPELYILHIDADARHLFIRTPLMDWGINLNT